MYNPRGGQRKLYKFDKVFGIDSSQEQVYEDTKALIRSVLDGDSAHPQTDSVTHVLPASITKVHSSLQEHEQ